jgi:hypothetical protein
MSPPENTSTDHSSDEDDYFRNDHYTTSPPRAGGRNKYIFPQHDKERSTPRSFRAEDGGCKKDKKHKKEKKRR